MIPPSFDYEAPTSVEEAVAILGKNPDAKVLAGGQSLIALMKLRLASPAVLVDINKIDGLGYINEDDGFLPRIAIASSTDVGAS